MSEKKVLPKGQAFTTLHGLYTKGSNPSKGEAGNPDVHIATFTRQNFQPEGEPLVIAGPARLEDQLLEGSTGTLTVADNDFSVRAVIILGQFRLTSGVDFAIGGSTAATATNIAASISQLFGFTAVANASDVEIAFDASLSRVTFRTFSVGDVNNFSLVPTDGFLEPGAPRIQTPVLT